MAILNGRVVHTLASSDEYKNGSPIIREMTQGELNASMQKWAEYEGL